MIRCSPRCGATAGHRVVISGEPLSIAGSPNKDLPPAPRPDPPFAATLIAAREEEEEEEEDHGDDDEGGCGPGDFQDPISSPPSRAPTPALALPPEPLSTPSPAPPTPPPLRAGVGGACPARAGGEGLGEEAREPGGAPSPRFGEGGGGEPDPFIGGPVCYAEPGEDRLPSLFPTDAFADVEDLDSFLRELLEQQDEQYRKAAEARTASS